MPPTQEVVSSKTFVEGYSFPYSVNQPSSDSKLEKDLVEISGLSTLDKGDDLLAVQDEKGRLFVISDKDGHIKKSEKFGGKNDYEGVEITPDAIYVVNSSGTLFEINKKDYTDVKTFKTALDISFDIEGLGFDAVNNRLLLACKSFGNRAADKRGVWGFDLKTKTLSKAPIFELSVQAIEANLKADKQNEGMAKILAVMANSSNPFGPSAIAVHPKTGNYYILAHQGKMLVVTNPAGHILHIAGLDKTIHRQPEGLTFLPDGTMFIANEGGGKKGLVYRYEIN